MYKELHIYQNAKTIFSHQDVELLLILLIKIEGNQDPIHYIWRGMCSLLENGTSKSCCESHLETCLTKDFTTKIILTERTWTTEQVDTLLKFQDRTYGGLKYIIRVEKIDEKNLLKYDKKGCLILYILEKYSDIFMVPKISHVEEVTVSYYYPRESNLLSKR